MRKFLRVAGPSIALPLVAGSIATACFQLGDDPVFLRDGGIVIGDATISFDALPPSEGGPRSDAGPDAPQPLGKVQGVVYDFMMADRGVVAGAAVSIAGLPPVTTDANGRFVIDNVPPGDRVLINVSRGTDMLTETAYSSTQVPVKVRGGVITEVFARLQEGCFFEYDVAPDGGTLSGASCERQNVYATLQLDSDSIARQNDTPFVGRMRVEVIPITFPQDGTTTNPDLSGFRGLPGDSAAIRKDMSLAVLESAGAAEFRISDDATGEVLKIATGKTGTIQMANYRAPANGETFLAWSYDTTRGLWVEEGPGTLTMSNSEGPIPVFETTVSHLSWWNIDFPRQNTCIKGTATLGGQPVAAALGLNGVDYAQWTSPTTANDDGTWCKDVRPSSQIAVVAEYFALPAFDLYRGSSVVASSTGQHSCLVDPSACTDVGSIALTPRDPGCARGVLKRNVPQDGGAVATSPITKPISVYAFVSLTQNELGAGWNNRVYIGQVTPAADGSFCTSLPAGFQYDFSDDQGVACGITPTQGPFAQGVFTFPMAQGTFCSAQTDGGGGDGGAGACADLGEIDIDCFYQYGQ